MNDVNFKEWLEDKFSDDPLWLQIYDSNLEEYLLQEELLDKLNTNNTYSLAQAAEILGLRDHNLRNYLNRHYLSEYIQPERIGKLYRLDYKSIFKFHMIFILVNQGKRSPTDIASYVGTKVETGYTTVRGNNRETPVNEPLGLSREGGRSNEAIEKRLESVEKSLFLLNWQRIVEQSKIELESSIRDIKDWENEITMIGQEIEYLELKKQINKQEKNTIELMKETHKRVGYENSKNNGFSFKNLFLRNKQTPINYDKVIDGVATTMENKKIDYTGMEQIETNINKLRTKMDKMQAKKEELFETKKEKEQKFKAQQKELEQFQLSIEGESSATNLFGKLLNS